MQYPHNYQTCFLYTNIAFQRMTLKNILNFYSLDSTLKQGDKNSEVNIGNLNYALVLENNLK